MKMKILVTGGAGFIGSAVIRELMENSDHSVVNVDKLTYAGNVESLGGCVDDVRYVHERADICDARSMGRVFAEYEPDMVMHLAAESHVDRSIDGPGEFMRTNILGTYTLLEVAHAYYKSLPVERRSCFKFHHVSTDEVFGDLGEGGYFTEDSNYCPSSPYSASKASSDHLVHAWNRTYGLPTVMSHCSNNYGPYHFPEKLIPLVILNALNGKKLPIYGDGKQVRDWLYVEDHARALIRVAMEGGVGESYHIGGSNERENIDVVKKICDLLDAKVDEKPLGLSSFSELICFVEDRPGHDVRYAIDAGKIERDLGWVPEESFDSGMAKTVDWYLSNEEWCRRVQDGSYKGERLGVNEQGNSSKLNRR